MCISEYLYWKVAAAKITGFLHWIGVKGKMNYVDKIGFIDASKGHFKFCALLFICALKYWYISLVLLEWQEETSLFPFWYDWKEKSIFASSETQKNLTVVKLNEK